MTVLSTFQAFTPESVLNQPEPLEEYNLYTMDIALQEAV